MRCWRLEQTATLSDLATQQSKVLQAPPTTTKPMVLLLLQKDQLQVYPMERTTSVNNPSLMSVLKVTKKTLYQTWEQYARTALGYALDRIAKLEQQRTSDLITIAELRTRIEQALARISSIETNEVDDDAVDTVLLTTVADLIERVEALEGA